MMARDLKEIDCERMYNAFRRFGRKHVNAALKRNGAVCTAPFSGYANIVESDKIPVRNGIQRTGLTLC